MKKFFAVSVMFVLLTCVGFAQTSYRGELPENHPDGKPFRFKHGIGLGASMMSGYGISYQYHITPKDRMEFTTFLYMNSHNDISDSEYAYEYDETDWYGNVALEYHRLLAERRYGKLFVMAGGGYLFNKSIYEDSNPNDNYTWRDDDVYTAWQAGSGLVLEFYIRDLNLTFNVDVGLAYRYEENFSDDILQSTDHYFGLAVGGGIYYTF